MLCGVLYGVGGSNFGNGIGLILLGGFGSGCGDGDGAGDIVISSCNEMLSVRCVCCELRFRLM